MTESMKEQSVWSSAWMKTMFGRSRPATGVSPRRGVRLAPSSAAPAQRQGEKREQAGSGPRAQDAASARFAQ